LFFFFFCKINGYFNSFIFHSLGLPKNIDFLEVQKVLNEIQGVLKVHNLRIWSLSLDKTALAAHLAIGLYLI
jgi:Co/Zn/Cd efflux system component